MRDQLVRHLTEALSDGLQWLERMVRTNSFTTNSAGVDLVGDLTAECFAPLGFVSERIPSINPLYGRHLILTRPGTSDRKMGLISHLDTVFSPEEELNQDFSWRRNGDRIYGPGTMDIKGGTIMIYLIMVGLQKACPDVFHRITWIIMENSSEEVLSRDFGELCLDRLRDGGVAALVFEAGGRNEKGATLVTGRKGRATFRVSAEGRGAHAGSRHQRGANAIVQLSEMVQRIAGFTNYSEGLTFNVGTISGGTVVNRVPHLATSEVELRAFTSEAYQAGIKAIMGLQGLSTIGSHEGDHRCRVSVQLLEETPPWPENLGTQVLFELWQKAAATIKLSLTAEQRGGVSDGNYLWHAIPTLDGLGPYGDNAHCSEQSADGTKEQEYVDLGSFVPRATAAVLAIQELAAGRR